LTPLNGILGLSDYLRDFAPSDENELMNIANSIHSCGERLYRLIENYLIYTRLLIKYNTPGEKCQERELIYIEREELIKLVSKNAGEDRIADLSFQVEDVEIKLNKSSYIKIVEELVKNAAKFSKPGNSIFVSSSMVQDNYILQVESIGSGIDPQQIQEMGAFVQFNRSFNEQQGLGLGLEIVRMITELNSGMMTIDSKKDEYFKVKLQIPFLM
jgi:signal transduction histidine kinase